MTPTVVYRVFVHLFSFNLAGTIGDHNAGGIAFVYLSNDFLDGR